MPFPPSDTPSAVLPGPVPPSSCWRIAMPNLGLPAALATGGGGRHLRACEVSTHLCATRTCPWADSCIERAKSRTASLSPGDFTTVGGLWCASRIFAPANCLITPRVTLHRARAKRETCWQELSSCWFFLSPPMSDRAPLMRKGIGIPGIDIIRPLVIAPARTLEFRLCRGGRFEASRPGAITPSAP